MTILKTISVVPHGLMVVPLLLKAAIRFVVRDGVLQQRVTNPSREARNRRATRGFVSPSARLRLRFGPHHKSSNVSY